jgi:hypothetical protein
MKSPVVAFLETLSEHGISAAEDYQNITYINHGLGGKPASPQLEAQVVEYCDTDGDLI